MFAIVQADASTLVDHRLDPVKIRVCPGKLTALHCHRRPHAYSCFRYSLDMRHYKPPFNPGLICPPLRQIQSDTSPMSGAAIRRSISSNISMRSPTDPRPRTAALSMTLSISGADLRLSGGSSMTSLTESTTIPTMRLFKFRMMTTVNEL